MRYRSPPIFEVDWTDSGQYEHALADVTSAVDDNFRATLGTSRHANLDRPTIAPLRGSLTLIGPSFSPGDSLDFTPPELRRRHRFRVTWAGTGTVEILCTGWIQEPQRRDSRAGKKRTKYRLEGFLEQRLQQHVELVHNQDNSDTVQAQNTLTDALGEPLESYTYDATDLTIFTFDGFFGELLSKFGAVVGAFPVETKAGGLGLHSPLASGTNEPTISPPDYVVSRLQSASGVEHVRNYAQLRLGNPEISRLPYVETPGICRRGQ